LTLSANASIKERLELSGLEYVINKLPRQVFLLERIFYTPLWDASNHQASKLVSYSYKVPKFSEAYFPAGQYLFIDTHGWRGPVYIIEWVSKPTQFCRTSDWGLTEPRHCPHAHVISCHSGDGISIRCWNASSLSDVADHIWKVFMIDPTISEDFIIL
jgi:hypothetical protein